MCSSNNLSHSTLRCRATQCLTLQQGGTPVLTSHVRSPILHMQVTFKAAALLAAAILGATAQTPVATKKLAGNVDGGRISPIPYGSTVGSATAKFDRHAKTIGAPGGTNRTDSKAVRGFKFPVMSPVESDPMDGTPAPPVSSATTPPTVASTGASALICTEMPHTAAVLACRRCSASDRCWS